MRTLRILLPLLLAISACSHPAVKSRSGAPSEEKGETKREAIAEKAVEKTEEDERQAPLIQKELNAIFFKGKDQNPGGLDAFSPDRIQDLELEIGQTDQPAIRYYRENRDYFDRVEDSGGGFRIVANAKRLVPHRWTKAGRKKLFEMDTARVREMIANPCFSEVEDCGEYASDGEENTSLLDEWVKKYGEKEYKIEREKVLRSYLAVLEKYQKRVARGVPPKANAPKSESTKTKRARQSAILVGTHIRGIQMLLKE
jgi:hypothetical protein